MTIAGTAFGATQGTSTVKFGTRIATVTSWSDTVVVATVPTSATTGNVVVIVSGSASNGVSFTVLGTPNIASLSPTSGAVGATVTLTGTNFGATQGSSTVKFNGTLASPTSWNATSIVVTVPAGATTGSVVVNASGVNSNGRNFTIVSAPTLTSLSPTTAAIGAVVTVRGTSFGSSQGAGWVKFNGTAGTPTSWSSTTIRVPVPVGATSGNVIVRAGGVESNGLPFTVIPPPNVTTVAPTSGPPGTPVTITGMNFGTAQGSSTVKFNGTTAQITNWSDTSVVALVPFSATTGSTVVTVLGATSNGMAFTVPTLTSLTVTPTDASLSIGAAQRFTAIGTYSDASTANLSANATWTSSDTFVATTSGTGLASGVRLGDTTIDAVVGAFNASATLAVVSSRFTFTGNLTRRRVDPTATVLHDGRVLVLGGASGAGTPIVQASFGEIYDPVVGRFTLTGQLITPRSDYTATRLPNGKILIVGGWSSMALTYLASSELYDPVTGTFTATGNLNFGRGHHRATLLNNGKVLIVGGIDTAFALQPVAELYDPLTGAFTTTGSLAIGRTSHTVTLLDDDRVLVAGGFGASAPLASAEIYDATAGTFTATGSLIAATDDHTATRLANGKVLIAGGNQGSSTLTAKAEVYDPTTGTFTATGSMNTARQAPAAILVNNGRVLIPGGYGNTGGSDGVLGTAELYDPTSGTFSIAGTLNVPRNRHAAVLLNDGMVLIVGGITSVGVSAVELDTAELYQADPTLPSPLSLHITPADGSILVGEPRQFTAVDHLGRPRPDATWMVSDTNLATITLDGSPTLTALSAGLVTLTASIGSVSAEVEITILAQTAYLPGTARWSVALPPGFSPLQVVYANSRWNTPDFYFLSTNGTETLVQALKDDGQQMWQQQLAVVNANSVPDAFGGLIVTEHNTCDKVNPMKISALEAESGRKLWTITGASTCTVDAPQIAVRADGNLIVATPGNTSGVPQVMVLEGRTGATLSMSPSQPINPSSYKDVFGQTSWGYSPSGPPMIASDGTAHLAYEVRHIDYPPRVTSAFLYLLTIPAGLSTSQTLLASTTNDENLFPGRIIPDGQGGLIATWRVHPSTGSLPQYPFQAAHVASGGGLTTYTLPFSPLEFDRDEDGLVLNPMLVLGENGTAFAAYGDTVASFDINSGAALWTYVSPSGKMSILRSTEGNGLVAKATANGVETVYRFNSSGAATVESWSGALIDYVAGESWTGAASGLFLSLTAGQVAVSASEWAAPTQKGQNQSVRSFYVPQPLETDPNQSVIRTVFTKIKAALQAESATPPQPSCSAWLATGLTTGPQMIDAVTSPSDRFGHGIISTVSGAVVPSVATDHIYAFTFGRNADNTPVGVPSHFAVTVNDNGAFFQALSPTDNSYELKDGKYRGGTVKAQARILIHELAHLLQVPGFLSDNGNKQAGKNNDKLVQKNCTALIETIQ